MSRTFFVYIFKAVQVSAATLLSLCVGTELRAVHHAVSHAPGPMAGLNSLHCWCLDGARAGACCPCMSALACVHVLLPCSLT